MQVLICTPLFKRGFGRASGPLQPAGCPDAAGSVGMQHPVYLLTFIRKLQLLPLFEKTVRDGSSPWPATQKQAPYYNSACS